MINIQIISDLHQEFGMTDLSFDNADIVVIAGDVNLGTKGIDWIKSKITKKPVVYVLGNHEYYKGSYPKTLNKIRAEAENTNVHVLEDDFVDIDDIGTVYPDEYVSGEMVLDTLHAHQRENTSLLVLGLDANVIF